MQSPIYVVVGMHRAGTSAIARGLMTLGISLGDNLMPPVPGNNETGFWEDMDVFALNEEVLAALGESVHSVRLFDERKLGEVRFRDLAARGQAVLAGKLKTFGTYGFKDPRTSRLLPFWQQVFAQLKLEARYIVATRHPISVAQSLQKRDGLGTEQSHVLWLEHMLAALHWTANCGRVVVDYDRLMENPAREIERVRIALRIPKPAGMKKRLADYAANFLSERLRHTHFDSRALREAPGMPACAVRLHQLLVRLAADEISPDDEACTAEIGRLWSETGDFSPVFALTEQLFGGIAGNEARLEQLSSELSARAGQIAALEAVIGGRDDAIGDRDVQLRQAASESVEREHRFAAEGASREQRIATLEATIMARDAELHRVGTDAALRGQQVANLEGALGERDARLTHLAGDIEAAARRMADLETEYLRLRHEAAGRERLLNRERERADAGHARADAEHARAEGLAHEGETALRALAGERGRAASLERFFADVKSSLDEQNERCAALQGEASELDARLQERTSRLDGIEGSSFWRATAWARTAWHFAESLLHRRARAFRLVPNADLQRGAGTDAWRSTGDDPQFRMVPADGSYPRGWVLVRTSLTHQRANRGAKLYVDAGDGMPEHSAIRVRIESTGAVRQIVRLPDRVAGLRWDPMEEPGLLMQQPIVLSEVGPIERRIHMLSRVWKAMRELPSETLARHGLTWRRTLTDLDGAYFTSSDLLGDPSVPAIAR